ncbi:hypothetical protein [Mycolicibacterium helvum]|uniref:hypothetical protein n=1 Tax=Mycolicibacterium helvum TaxID=1534349 RepID=UPI0013D5EF27|nr:hypothetical protein [Mycolicibacterium helvum]
MLWAPAAAADPGTVGNNHGGRGADSRSDSNDARRGERPGAHRPGGPGKPHGTDVKPGTTRPGDGAAAGSRRGGELPGRHWNPGVPGHHGWPPPGPPGQHVLPGQHGWPPSGWPEPGWPSSGWPEPGWPPSGWLNPDWQFPQFPPIVLPPLPPWHWPPRATSGDGVGDVGVARPPSLGIGQPPAAVGGGGSGGGITVQPRTIPPGEPGQPGEPPVVSAERGTIGPTSLEPPPITMPPLIGLPPAFSAPRPIGPGAEPGPRTGPGRESAATRERPPATSAGAGTEMPPSTRVGYPRYLQEAKMGEVAALALPGFAGILALTALGGVVGYRQARAGHVVRTAGTARFMQ